MEYSEGYWNTPYPQAADHMLSQEDVTDLVSLMTELRELTQSRRTYSKATEFLRRFNGEINSPSLVPADTHVQ